MIPKKPTLRPSSTPFMINYKMAAVELSTLIKSNKGMSSRADRCRETMDANWIKCTEDQQEVLSQYNDDLYNNRDTSI